MLSTFRLLPTAAATAILVALAGCVSPTASNTGSTASPGASPAAIPAATSGHSGNHGGKPGININTAILSELDKLEAKLGSTRHFLTKFKPAALTEKSKNWFQKMSLLKPNSTKSKTW